MIRVLALALCVLAFAGCRKKSSKEFYEAQGDHSTLVARLGDDAYVDEGMAAIQAKLAQVPAEAQEGPEAEKLLALISSESARVAEARKASADAVAAAARPSLAGPAQAAFADRPAVAEPAVATADAGQELRPSGGMPLAQFQKAFGDCVTPDGEDELPMVGKGPRFAIKDTQACTRKLGVSGNTSYIFVEGKLRGMSQKVSHDAGMPSVPKVPVPRAPIIVEPAGPLIPGAPAPGAVHDNGF